MIVKIIGNLEEQDTSNGSGFLCNKIDIASLESEFENRMIFDTYHETEVWISGIARFEEITGISRKEIEDFIDEGDSVMWGIDCSNLKIFVVRNVIDDISNRITRMTRKK